MTIAITEVFPRYLPMTQIGRGATAEVILAEMQMGDGVTSLVALKRLLPELAEDPEFVAMFQREGRLSVGMNHTNIVRTYESVQDAEGPVIAMEYLDGQPLARVLNRLMGPNALDLSARLRALVDVLQALDYAHELRAPDGSPQGIVHRDVNPHNVFVTYDGVVKLLDFGVATSVTDSYFTRPGALRGKLAYLAPEQALGEVVDRRADVFSVGVMLWEMVTGRRMWQAMTETSIMRQLASGAIPILPRDPSLPRGLSEICACALARSPQRRFTTADEFAAELRTALRTVGEGKRSHLGRVLTLAFAPERAARRTLIEEHRRRVRGGNRPSHRWTNAVGGGGAAGETQSQSNVRPERVTPGGMWSLEGAAFDPLVSEASASDPPRPPVAPQASSTQMRFPRARWMAVGFAIAAVLAAVTASIATRSRLRPFVTGWAVPVSSVPAAVPAQPLIVPVAPAPPNAPPPPALPVAEDAQRPGAAAIDEERTATHQRNRPHERPVSGEPVRAEAKTNRQATDEVNSSSSRFDDETLEPTFISAEAGLPASSTAASRRLVPSSGSASASRVLAAPRTTARTIDVTDPFAP